jgi:opacity protein-like surface antigen
MPVLAVGTVKLHVEFPGFEPSETTLALKRGANNQNVTLGIAGVQEEVVVNDTNALLDDRSGNAQTTTLEQEEIDSLPDDPDELAEYLRQMTGGSGATFQVNGFRGGRLPSRDEIRQIRFRTNSFSADNHDAGRTQIEIITRPNVREWSGNANMGLRGDMFNARNAFAQTETPEQFRRFNTSVRGPIVIDKTSIRFGLDGNRSYDSPPIYAKNEDGTQFHAVVRRPSESTNATVGVEHALTRNQTLRLEYRGSTYNAENQGVGDFTMPERAVTRSTDEHQVRFQVQGLIGKTTLHELRVQFRRQSNEATSVSDAVTINVLDAFNKGGAGVNNYGSSGRVEIADNVDFSIGRKHAMRVGALIEGGVNRNFDARNANGTFTFSSLDAYNAGLPLQFTQRNGQVDTRFTDYEAGVYWQDDIRVNRNFSVSVGVRQEFQSLIDDKLNVMPRLGFSWNAPAKLTLRGGYGTFYDWYDTGLYDQTLRVNGVSQRDLLIMNPGYPIPFFGADTVILPGGRVQAAADLQMPYVHQASIGVERAITDNLQTQVSYQMLRGRRQMRSVNVNAPGPDGVRPEPNIGTVTQFESTGRSLSDRFNVNLNYRLPNRRIFMGGNYTLGQVKNHADSATSLPANSLDPDAEWGPSLQDIRHRANFNFNMPFVFGMRANFNGFAQSAAPYNITTGRDDNLDGVVNDRPAGVGRNAARGASRFDMTIRLSRQFGFGPARTTPGGPGGRQGGGGGRGGGGAAQQVQGPGGPGGPGGGAGNPFGANQRFSAELWISANNVLNRVNYLNFVGNIQSPFFGTATSAAPPRRIEVGVNFRF